MEQRAYKPKLNTIRTINPQKFNDKIKFYTNGGGLNAIFQSKNNKNKIPFKIKKNKFQNKTFFEQNEKENFPKIQQLNGKKTNIFNPKLRHINSDHFNFNKVKKIRSSSQDHNQTLFAQNKFRDIYSSKMEKEIVKIEPIINKDIEPEAFLNINISDFMEKIKKDYSDIGKLIKIKLIVDEERKYDFEKNEFVILKIIENDLKQNHGLEIKDFVLNDQTLNRYKSLKDNKIENNSEIKVIL